jgi:hypothetical protein
MKKIIITIVLFISTFSMAQENQKWIFGWGWNTIDNTATKDRVYFQTKDWNSVPALLKASLSYNMKEHLTVGTEYTFNKYLSDKMHNGRQNLIKKDLIFIGVDVNGKYNVDHFFTQAEWFDVSVIGGVGLFWLDDIPNQSFNPGLAIDFWMSDDYGIRLQTLGRVAFNNNKLGNNHIQHSVEFLVKF